MYIYIYIYIISYFEMVLQGRWLVHNVTGISRLLRTFLICFQNICHCVLFYLSCNWEEPNVRTNTVCCQWLQEMFTQINKKKKRLCDKIVADKRRCENIGRAKWIWKSIIFEESSISYVFEWTNSNPLIELHSPSKAYWSIPP